MDIDRKKELNSILHKYKYGDISNDKAQRLIAVVFGEMKTASCSLDRLPKDCSTFNYTSIKDCSQCGLYIK